MRLKGMYLRAMAVGATVAVWAGVGFAQTDAAPGAISAPQRPAAVAAGPAPAVCTGCPAPIPLWANGAPGALGTADDDTPTLQVFLPAQNPTKTGVVIA